MKSGRERTGIDAVTWAREAVGAAREILSPASTRTARAPGTIPLVLAVARAVRVPVIASGGAAGPEHLWEALRAPGPTHARCSQRRSFHDGEHTPDDVKRELRAFGAEVRL
ncbi:MAG: HisA/HisF-related TIM barrel protein [Polyangiaceae bacterium]